MVLLVTMMFRCWQALEVLACAVAFVLSAAWVHP